MHQFPVRKRYGYEQMLIHDHKSRSGYDAWLEENAPTEGASWFGGGVMHNDWTAKPWHLEESLHFTNWVTDRTLRWLDERDPSCPFFLTASYVAPHPPLQPPAFYLERYLRTGVREPDIGDWAEAPSGSLPHGGVSDSRVNLTGEALLSARAGYYGLINHLDDQIRRLTNPVLGVDKMTGRNTIVVYTSDHGEMLGDHHLWRKNLAFESAARIPLFLRAPKRFGIAPETVRDEAVCLEDIMPTLLDLAGVAIPGTVEGKSLAPLMRGESPAWREALPVEHAPAHQCMTDGREKYIWQVADGREFFFDLRDDPLEMHNLAATGDAEDRIAPWRARLIERLKDRPEGFVQNGKLTPGRTYSATLPHAGMDPA
jgi:arylsulfatase